MFMGGHYTALLLNLCPGHECKSRECELTDRQGSQEVKPDRNIATPCTKKDSKFSYTHTHTHRGGA